jgi:hypothetical protein
MSENRISATLAAADHQAVMTAINTIREKLPFLIDLSPEERRALPKMGDKSRAVVSQALDVATQNSDFLPRSFDVEEMRKDVELATALQSISASLTQLQELVEDSSVAVGSEAYMAALVVYNYAQSNGRGGALDNLLDAMGQRFARKNRQPATPTPPTP